MYHEETYKQVAARRRTYVAYVVLVAVIAAAVAFSVFSARGLVQQQAAGSMRDAVVRASVQCLAVEGSYPPTLDHLEERYGLVVNHSDFVVTYEWLGDNVPPSVVVRPR